MPQNTSSSPGPDGDRLLTVPELAAQLGIQPRTIHNWRVRGFGPPVAVKLPKRILFRQSAVDEWLAQHPDTSRQAARQ